jgi:hypothetical protein
MTCILIQNQNLWQKVCFNLNSPNSIVIPWFDSQLSKSLMEVYKQLSEVHWETKTAAGTTERLGVAFQNTANTGIYLVMCIWEWAADWKIHQLTSSNSISEVCASPSFHFALVDGNCTWHVLVTSNIVVCRLDGNYIWFPILICEWNTRQGRSQDQLEPNQTGQLLLWWAGGHFGTVNLWSRTCASWNYTFP